ncbi:hypothetical protein [Methylobacterium frigidaeris]|uniref:hypothetical protein n=1 Tax=Methylobacterium frigidaeris TaxID=2038277 RepID=UPI001EDE3E6B|nr:hypothetical protein [Methylobacterium frigidaeris]
MRANVEIPQGLASVCRVMFSCRMAVMTAAGSPSTTHCEASAAVSRHHADGPQFGREPHNLARSRHHDVGDAQARADALRRGSDVLGDVAGERRDGSNLTPPGSFIPLRQMNRSKPRRDQRDDGT